MKEGINQSFGKRYVNLSVKVCIVLCVSMISTHLSFFSCTNKVGRDFAPNVHNPLEALIVNRVKYQLGYPEAAKDMIASKSLLTAVEQYTMGSERSLSDYLKMTGMNMITKEITEARWCMDGVVSSWLLLLYVFFFSCNVLLTFE